MDALESQMKQCCTLNGVQLFVCKFTDHLLHLFRYKDRGGGRMISTHDAYRNAAVYAPILRSVHQCQCVDLLDDILREWNLVLHEEEGISVAGVLEVVFQGLFVNGNTLQNQRSLLKGQGIALDYCGASDQLAV